MNPNITEETLRDFRRCLEQEERSPATIAKYLWEVRSFAGWLEGRRLDKGAVTEWKNFLLETGYAPTTINAKLAALNRYLTFCGIPECKAKALRLQRELFQKDERSLTQGEYLRLVRTARECGKERIALIMETLCATGIRVSELRFITMDTLRKGYARVCLKGKIREILLPRSLQKKLRCYARRRGIRSGELFRGRKGQSLSRKYIWAEMKKLCGLAQIEPRKVFPHNLRHLFAVTFHRAYRDISKLADILGHSNIETTRIYLKWTCSDYYEILDRLELVVGEG